MYGQTPILLSVAVLALLGSLPRLLEKDEAAEDECPGPGGAGGGGAPCAVPFLSHNPLTLRCPGAGEAEEGSVHWQYLNLSRQAALASASALGGPGSAPSPSPPRPRTFIGPRGVRAQRGPLTELSGRALVRGGALLLARARPSDSGLYLCKAGAGGAGGQTLASYRVDVQDSALLHVSHRGLGQAPLRNQTVRLAPGGGGAVSGGRQLLLHTHWSPWQDCDRCGATGERKRLGFCYAALLPEDEEGEEGEGPPPLPQAPDTAWASPDLPCGLMQLRLGQALPRRGPELRYETCRRDCGAAHDARELANQAAELLGDMRAAATVRAPPPTLEWLEPRALLLETLMLDLHADARMACPGASVYTPVSWQRDATLLTRLELLRRCNGTHRLEEATGGGAYRIAGLRRADQGVYRCWVRGRRAAAFHLELPELPPRRRLHSRQLLGALRAVLGAFALVFVVSALGELLHSCWCEVL